MKRPHRRIYQILIRARLAQTPPEREDMHSAIRRSKRICAYLFSAFLKNNGRIVYHNPIHLIFRTVTYIVRVFWNI